MTMPEDLPRDRPLDGLWLAQVVAAALDEDLGGRPGDDVTTLAIIDPDAVATGSVVMRQSGVVAGIGIVGVACDAVSARLGLPACEVTVIHPDGTAVESGTSIAHLTGPATVLLIAERTMLNLMSRASGIATHTRQWIQALAGTSVMVADTRKTTPLLRELEKYSVRCGGGINKRFGLFDCAMIKDNHIAASGSITAAIAAIERNRPGIPIQVEVETDQQAWEALAAGCRFLMLDNMDVERMAALVTAIRQAEPTYGAVRIEATGGITLANAPAVAATGVDYISVGALTHSSPIIDIALDLDAAPVP